MNKEEKNILNIPLRKEYALQILKGKKKREFRTFNDHWATRICLFEDDKDKNIATGIKWFDIAHFYPYNKKWFLDVEIYNIEWRIVDKEFLIEYSNEVDAQLNDILFIIHLGKVIDTNLSSLK